MRLSWVSSSFFVVLVSLGAQTTAPDLGRRGVAVDKPASIDRKISSSDVPRGFGLIIGIAEYGNLTPAMNLRYPERDADLMYNVLTSKEGGNFRPEDVRELIGPKATLKNVTEALETWLPSVARENDRVVIYFAGHGFLDEERVGTGVEAAIAAAWAALALVVASVAAAEIAALWAAFDLVVASVAAAAIAAAWAAFALVVASVAAAEVAAV